MEGRGLTKENVKQLLLDWTLRQTARSRGLLGVREAAQRDQQMRFNNLLHHVTPELLGASFFALKKSASPGIDGVTWAQYAEDFETRIDDLHSRIHRGMYRAQPSKREVIIVRYADDFVIGFREESDAKRCLAALRERFTKFGLELHPEKTRLIEFGRYAAERRKQRGAGPPETFDFLGFTHISGKTRKGDFTIRRISSIKKLRNKLRELKDSLKRKMHLDLTQVGSWILSVFRGWCNYHAIPGNSARLQQFRTAFQELWLRVLRRRSQRGRRMTWLKFSSLIKRWLPTPRILHPYPEVRFDRLHPR